LIGALTAAACLVFLRLPHDAGAELAGRSAAKPAEQKERP
jgi:hypothetical protein